MPHISAMLYLHGNAMDPFPSREENFLQIRCFLSVCSAFPPVLGLCEAAVAMERSQGWREARE
jgi:hypothetical protein